MQIVFSFRFLPQLAGVLDGEGTRSWVPKGRSRLGREEHFFDFSSFDWIGVWLDLCGEVGGAFGGQIIVLSCLIFVEVLFDKIGQVVAVFGHGIF